MIGEVWTPSVGRRSSVRRRGSAPPMIMTKDVVELSRQRPWTLGLQEEREKAQRLQTMEILRRAPHSTPCKLKVVLRVRPFGLPFDTTPNVLDSAPRLGDWISVEGGERQQFTTAVLGPEATQHDVYKECAMPLLEAALGGQHSCLFAYGQTGSGKTFSMLGAEGGRCPAKLDGIVPQLVGELFRRFARQTTQGEREYQIHVSYVEIYSHRVYDLIAPEGAPSGPGAPRGGGVYGARPPELALRETSDGDFLVVGATTERVYSSAGLTNLIERATARRTTSSNDVHEHSSRSHAFLTLHLERRTAEGGVERRQTTRFHLVDLAGSENFDSKESDVGINFGLLALGKVLMSLAAEQPVPHVPYRDATLTKMLKHVLNGNCVNMMLGCLNPTKACVGETTNTLRYARRASNVINQTRTQTFEDTMVSDPMKDDAFDADEEMNCRAEAIQTSKHGEVYARMAGDPVDPLVLYLHGAGSGSDGRIFNDLVRALAAKLKAAKDGPPDALTAAALLPPPSGSPKRARPKRTASSGNLLSAAAAASAPASAPAFAPAPAPAAVAAAADKPPLSGPKPKRTNSATFSPATTARSSSAAAGHAAGLARPKLRAPPQSAVPPGTPSRPYTTTSASAAAYRGPYGGAGTDTDGSLSPSPPATPFAPSLFVEEEAPRPKGRSLLDLQAALSSALVTRQMQLVEKECVLCGYATLCEARTLD